MSEEVYSDNPISRVGEWTFVNYTTSLSPKQARWVLIALLISVLAGELILRVKPPTYDRATQNSMHGIREQILNLSQDPRPKVIGVGDSSFVGSGVFDASKTVMGLIRTDVGKSSYVANLSLPGGNCATSLMLLDSLKTVGVSNIKDIIIEVLPDKFMSVASTSNDQLPEAAKELQRFDPYTTGDSIPHLLSTQEDEESLLEWKLSQISAIYRNKDVVRNHKIGMYPSFFAIGAIAPQKVLDKVLGSKAGGNNRLSAKVEDRPFAQSDRKPSDEVWQFSPTGEAHFLEKTIQAAKALQPERIIVLEDPVHYTFYQSAPEIVAGRVKALGDVDAFLTQTCAKNKVNLLIIPSAQFQEDAWWTRTFAHFREGLHQVIYEKLKPML